jgi:hypothetical protein
MRDATATFAWSVLLACGTLFTACARTPPDVAGARDLRAIASARARVVWARDMGDGSDVWAERGNIALMGLDTDDGRGARAILPAPGSRHLPLLTKDGSRVVFTDNAEDAVFVVGFDGANLRKVAGHGVAVELWADPADGREWVYCWIPANRHGIIRRVPLDGGGVADARTGELVWDRSPADKHNFDLSRDGTRAAGLLPWPDAHVAELPNQGSQRFGGGCCTSMAPDDSYYAWVFDGSHRGVNLRGPGGISRHVDIHGAPGVDGWEVYHPRWSNHPRFIGMTGPYKKGSMGGNNIRAGGKGVEVYVGRFDPDYTRIEAWARVTNDAEADFIPAVWIEGGETVSVMDTVGEADRKLRETAFRPAADREGAWPGSHDGLVYLWEGWNRPNRIRDEGAGVDRSCRATLRGKAVPAEGGAVDLAGGALVAQAIADELLAACRASSQLALEAVFTPDTLDQRGPARIVSFSSGSASRNFTLGQEGDRLILRLRTPSTGDNGVDPETTLCTLEAGRTVHLLASYAPGDLRVFADGKPILRSDAVQGDFSNWSEQTLLFGDEVADPRDWSGRLHAVALYARSIGAEEAALKHGQWTAREAARPTRRTVKVEARLATLPPAPSPEEMGAYRRALNLCEYDVIRVLEGECDEPRIAVAHWALLDNQPVESYGKRTVGGAFELEIVPLEECPELEGERRFDDLSDPTLPLFYDDTR